MQYSKNFYQIKSNDIIFEAIKKEIDTIGYYNLPLHNSNSTIISEINSKLTYYANKNNIKTFEIPKNVGGRFSFKRGKGYKG
ncbi:MAG: hypothetical protein U9Q30_09670 [Campylobacterota bacterium]|nr:hypothetical protein [Campylobacterota bacterium]